MRPVSWWMRLALPLSESRLEQTSEILVQRVNVSFEARRDLFEGWTHLDIRSRSRSDMHRSARVVGTSVWSSKNVHVWNTCMEDCQVS